MADDALSEEYTTESDRRRRIRYVVANDSGEYHRIEEEYREDQWVETGEELVHEIIIETDTYTFLL